MKIEKERKFILKRVPENIDIKSGIKMEQYYLKLSAKETEQGFDVKRIRRSVWANGMQKAYLTFKSRGLMERLESEKEITADEFEMLKKSAFKYISKVRCIYELNEFTVELDVFGGRDLIMAEIESPEAEKFCAPGGWKEVTGDPSYQNVNLAVDFIK